MKRKPISSLKLLSIMLTLLCPFLAQARKNYEWQDFRVPLDRSIMVCHNKPISIEVDLPQTFLDSIEDLSLDIEVTSKTYLIKNEDKGNSFESYSPWLKVNDSFWGSYIVPVDPYPAHQKVQLSIKKKYLQAGKNTFKVIERRYNSGCSSDCCGFLVDSLSFTDAPKPKYKLFITSTPSNAKITLDGKYVGTTPVEDEVDKGWHSIVYKMDAFKDYKKSVNLPRDSLFQHVILEKVEPLDTEPPVVEVSGTKNRHITVDNNQSTYQIRGKVRDESRISSARINKNSVSVMNDGTFTFSIPLQVGNNPVVIEATDESGNKLEKTYIVERLSPKIIPETFIEKEVKQKVTTVKERVIQEKKICLVIGNDTYQHGGELKNAVRDAKGVSESLSRLGFDVLFHKNLNQKEMKKAIDVFGTKLKAYDVGLFFYAGHGIQVDGTNFLIPVDAHLVLENDVEYDCVQIGRVLAKMEHTSGKTSIVILDACRDNPFERSWRRGAKGKGLAFMNAPTGTLIAYATSPGKTASDGVNGNGLYTASLLKHIETRNISALQMFQRVRRDVIKGSQGAQTPWESTSLTSDFFFNAGTRQ